METNELLSYLNKPETLRGDALTAMEGLVERHPYFGMAQCLLAIGYQNEGDERYDRQLKRAACATPQQGKAPAVVTPGQTKGTATPATRRLVLQVCGFRKGQGGDAKRRGYPGKDLHHPGN